MEQRGTTKALVHKNQVRPLLLQHLVAKEVTEVMPLNALILSYKTKERHISMEAMAVKAAMAVM